MSSNWSIKDTKELFSLVYASSQKGQGLSRAFEAMAKTCNKSVNSIRNYYYSQLKLFEMMPAFADELGIRIVAAKRETFTVFSAAEIDRLLRDVLTGKAAGRSVRAVIAELSRGDKKLALRLQNKYRSMVQHHRTRVEAVMHALRDDGKPYFDPYSRRTVQKTDEDDNVRRLAEYIATMDSDAMAEAVKRLLSNR